jgi:hypothetical protein
VEVCFDFENVQRSELETELKRGTHRTLERSVNERIQSEIFFFPKKGMTKVSEEGLELSGF